MWATEWKFERNISLHALEGVFFSLIVRGEWEHFSNISDFVWEVCGKVSGRNVAFERYKTFALARTDGLPTAHLLTA